MTAGPVWQSAGVGESFAPIRGVADVDAGWLTAILHRAGIGAGREIVAVDRRSIGTGQVGDNVRFRLAWDEPSDGLPATVVGKFPSQSEVSRQAALATGTYVREVGFYRDLQASVSIRTPSVLHVGWDAATHDFVVIMEDISPAEPGDQLVGCTVAAAELVVDAAVGLHAPTWGAAAELAHLDWLSVPSAERTEQMSGLVQLLWPGFEARYRGRLHDADLALGAALVERYRRWAEQTAEWAARAGGWCVVHGDYRLDNVLFGSANAPAVTIVDWQTVTVGIGPADIAYFCGAGLLPPVRAAHERALVERYAAGLAAAGVAIPADVLWEGYVLGSASLYVMAVIASQIVERTERGDEMFAVMAERHAAQIGDVGLLDRM